MDWLEDFVMFGEKIDEKSHKLQRGDFIPFIGAEFYRARCEAQSNMLGNLHRAERFAKTLLLNVYSVAAITGFAGGGMYSLDYITQFLK